MSELRVTIVPVGRMDPTEVQEAASRVSKVLHRAVELREAAPLSRGAEEAARGQFRALQVLEEGLAVLPSLKVQKLVGGAAAEAPVATARPDATVFVTDVDLFTPGTESVINEADRTRRAAVVSVRRLREAFYRRKSDPSKQRARLVKEILRAIGRIHGLQDCRDPGCAVAPTQAPADIDRKGERYCAACWKRLATGTIRI